MKYLFFCVIAMLNVYAGEQWVGLPIVDKVFFDSGSAELPNRYIKFTRAETLSFVPDALTYVDEITFYNNILNLVGYRMRQHPEIRISLHSMCRAESDSATLIDERKRSLKRYLVEVWGIEAVRIEESKVNSDIIANPKTVVGKKYNRHVQFRSKDYRLFDMPWKRQESDDSSSPVVEFSLIQFPFDRAKLSEQNKRDLKVVEGKVKKDDSIEVTYWELWGVHFHNPLGERRAKLISEYLKWKWHGIAIIVREIDDRDTSLLPEQAVFAFGLKVRVFSRSKRE